MPLQSQIEQQSNADKGTSGQPTLSSCDMLATISDDGNESDNEKAPVEHHDDHDKENVALKNSEDLACKSH